MYLQQQILSWATSVRFGQSDRKRERGHQRKVILGRTQVCPSQGLFVGNEEGTTQDNVHKERFHCNQRVESLVASSSAHHDIKM